MYVTVFSGRPSVTSNFAEHQPPGQGVFAMVAKTLNTPSFSSGPIGTVPSRDSHVTGAPEQAGWSISEINP